MQVSVTSATRRHVLNEPLSSPLCCAAQGRHHCPHSCFLCSFYKFLMSVLKEPASRTWEMGNKSLLWFYSFSAPCGSGVLDWDPWGPLQRWIVCEQRWMQSKVMEEWGLPRVTWEIVNPGRCEDVRHCMFQRTLTVPYGRVCFGGSEWSRIIWGRLWPTCWGRGPWSSCSEVGVIRCASWPGSWHRVYGTENEEGQRQN